ncbi:MAG TPA: methyltransferase [Tepidisphaeraceae bacterium]
MPAPTHADSSQPPLHVQLIDMARAHWVSQIVYVTAKLGLADHLANGARGAEELAGPTGTHAPSLYRLMRTLTHLGILTDDTAKRFTLTEMGATLKTGAPGAARSTILTVASGWFTSGFGELLYSLQTGKSGFEKSLGMPIFQWLAENPEEASRFSETMIGFHWTEAPAVAAAYDFSGAKTIVDVGGATGHFLSAVLERHPQPHGILFDLPHVVRDAGAVISSHGLSNRISVESGSFFETVPSGGDTYILSHIIHDWSEDQCLTILANCRRAMPKDARLLIVEMVIPPGNTPHPGKILDIMMLVGPGGQERTEQEYSALLNKAGFRLTRVVPTASPASVVEAVIA